MLPNLQTLRLTNRLELLTQLDLKPADVGIEIGVASGWFSHAILSSTQIGHLWSLDPWSRPIDQPLDDAHTSTVVQHIETIRKLAPYQERSSIIRATSEEGVRLFDDNFFSFVYIDADHTYEAIKQDIALWYPKVKPGSVLAGHDYSGNCAGVMRAVDEFVREHNLPFNMTDCDEVNLWTVRSWYMVKPVALSASE